MFHFVSLSPFLPCGRLLCKCFSIDEDIFSKASEASVFQGSKEGIIWIFANGYMTTLMPYHQWIAELMCFICFRGYSNTNVLLRLKKVHDLNTNRKYSMILLFCCWGMQGFLAYPGFSCPSLASLLYIFFSLYCFLQSLALSFQSIDSLGSPDTEVSFVLLSTCLNGNQRPQLPSPAIFCSVEDSGWHQCRFHLVMLAAFTLPLGLL